MTNSKARVRRTAQKKPLSRGVRRARAFVVVAGALTLGFAVLPSRLWISQQREIERAKAQLIELRKESKALERQVAELSRPDVVERQAREDLALVYPYDELYAVAPAPVPTVELPDVWPFSRVEASLKKAAEAGG